MKRSCGSGSSLPYGLSRTGRCCWAGSLCPIVTIRGAVRGVGRGALGMEALAAPQSNTLCSNTETAWLPARPNQRRPRTQDYLQATDTAITHEAARRSAGSGPLYSMPRRNQLPEQFGDMFQPPVFYISRVRVLSMATYESYERVAAV